MDAVPHILAQEPVSRSIEKFNGTPEFIIIPRSVVIGVDAAVGRSAWIVIAPVFKIASGNVDAMVKIKEVIFLCADRNDRQGMRIQPSVSDKKSMGHHLARKGSFLFGPCFDNHRLGNRFRRGIPRTGIKGG